MDWINHYDSPLGRILIASDGTALTGLWFDDQKYFAQGLSQEYKKADLPIFEQTAKWLDIYFSGSEPDFTPALNIRSTEFRRRVYNILLAIPYGQTMTYGKIAELLNKEPGFGTTSARAVGNAVGHNPISIVVPCHRVLGSDGSLTGYAGGTDRKARLLELER